jgi:MFS family permease
VSTAQPTDLRPAAALGVLGTLAVILPAFLTGAMAVQIRGELGLSDVQIGLAIGSFFVGSAAGSTLLGRLAEQLGAILAIRLGLVASIVADLTIAAAARSAGSLIAVLAVAGLANALTQPAINLLLVRVVAAERLGFVMALKQSGMPGASLVGGLAVPTLALTVGWQAGYLVAAVAAVAALLLTTRLPLTVPTAPGRPGETTPTAWRPRPDLDSSVLVLMAGVGVLGGGAANIVVAYLVSGAVDAGISPGPAGLLLTFGSALGITSRLIHGRQADRARFDVLGRVITMFLIGAVGAGALAWHTSPGYLVATPVVFAAGWAWPGLFNLVVVNANRAAPAAATGVTQTGVYLGSLAGPVIAGLLVERFGYRPLWLLTAALLAGACGLAIAVRQNLPATRTAADATPGGRHA